MLLNLNHRDRICFLGDSITANGQWIAEITEHFLNNYYDLKIGLYNCGIAGSKSREANLKDRLFCDCLNYFPKYTVVMFGMNDIGMHLYNISGNEAERQDCLVKYEQGLETIISLCQKFGSTPIICSPTPYDEYTVSDTENYFADKGIKACRSIAEKIAEKHKLFFIDMYSEFIKYMPLLPVSEDRVHPNELGQHIMAEIFLNKIGEKVEIEPDKPCVLSEKNKLRYDIEKKLRLLMFVERDGMLWQQSPSKPIEERKMLAKEHTAEGFFAEALKVYLENIDFLDEIRGDIVKKTIEMYD